MQVTSSHQALQDFVWAISYGKFDDINVATIEGQVQALDHLMQLLHYCEQYGTNIPEGLHIFSELFALPSVEKFFTHLFVNLDESLFLKAESVYLRGLAFTVDYIGLPKSRETVYLLLEKLQERFPVLKETYKTAIANFIEEFFRPTIGDFIKEHKNAVDHLELTYPFLYALFVAPLKAPQFADYRLYNFYCNPWIYQRIIIYLAYHGHQGVLHERIEAPLKWLEESAQIIRNQTNDDSWKEFSQKAHSLCNHSNNLEAFATQSSGLLGEIKAAVQFIKNQCHSKDLLMFLPEIQNDGKSCDLMVIRFKTRHGELIESKAKSPRHGLDVKAAGDAQIWDDFFDNFTSAISSYLQYIQRKIQSVLGLPLGKCYPLFSAYEGSRYGIALPLVENILTSQAITNVSVSTFSSEEKLVFLLRVLFLRPLTLDTACVPLASERQRLVLREQTTKEALQKKWVSSLLKQAIDQLEETRQRQLANGQKISKMHAALDLALSYRLLQDPFGYHDGNIKEIAEQTLQEAFQPFKDAFAAQGLELHLLVIQP